MITDTRLPSLRALKYEEYLMKGERYYSDVCEKSKEQLEGKMAFFLLHLQHFFVKLRDLRGENSWRSLR